MSFFEFFQKQHILECIQTTMMTLWFGTFTTNQLAVIELSIESNVKILIASLTKLFNQGKETRVKI